MRPVVHIVAEAGRRPRIASRGGLAARLTAADTVHLVSSAAAPLGGDVVTVRLEVGPGARLVVRSVAATVALPAAGETSSRSVLDADVSGDLDVDLQPLIVAADARHHATTTVRLADGAALRWRERVQIGRAGESAGFYVGALHADVAGMPLLRHRVELGAGSLADDTLAPAAAMIGEIRWPDVQTPAPTDPRGLTVMALAAGGSLSTWQGARLPSDRS